MIFRKFIINAKLKLKSINFINSLETILTISKNNNKALLIII